MDEKKRTILVVDDNEELRAAICRALTGEGYKTQDSANGMDALILMQYKQPDLIITDVRMPKVDGLDMVEGLKNRPETKNIPVIIITAYREDESYTRAHDAKVKYVLLKPFEMDELKKMVGTVFRQMDEQEVNKSGLLD